MVQDTIGFRKALHVNTFDIQQRRRYSHSLPAEVVLCRCLLSGRCQHNLRYSGLRSDRHCATETAGYIDSPVVEVGTHMGTLLWGAEVVLSQRTPSQTEVVSSQIQPVVVAVLDSFLQRLQS